MVSWAEGTVLSERGQGRGELRQPPVGATLGSHPRLTNGANPRSESIVQAPPRPPLRAEASADGLDNRLASPVAVEPSQVPAAGSLSAPVKRLTPWCVTPETCGRYRLCLCPKGAA
jgi:hypothetical protein